MDDDALNSLHECLANQRRRYILTYLSDTEEDSATVDTLVDHVVEQETHSPSPDRVDVATALYHVHLPKLEHNGLIDHDTERGVVTATDRIDQIESL